MSDIFSEVDEEIRKEQYAKLWKRYGIWAIAAAVLLVLGVAGYQGWQAYERNRAIEASNRYAEAMTVLETQGTSAAMAALDDLVAPEGTGYGLIAALRQAALKAEAGDHAAAVSMWGAVARNETAPEGLRDAATILSVMHRLDIGEGAPEALDAELTDLAEGEGAFRVTALELRAALALKAGERTRAAEIYKQIADGVEARAGQRQRATQMLSRLEG